MSKKKKNKRTGPSTETGSAQKPFQQKNNTAKKFRLHLLIIIIFSFILYGNTLQNGFAFDDSVVITGNAFTKQGLKGIPSLVTNDLFTGINGQSLELIGGRFRPLPLVTHAIEYELWGEKHPGYDHFVNILLYALAGFLMFLTLDRLLKGATITAFIATLLFIAHPIHTEVVANIKSRDEIICFIFLMLTLNSIFKFIADPKRKYLLFGFLFYLLALLTKENAITFIAIIPLTLYFFSETSRKEIFKRTLPYVGIAIFYLLIRAQILNTGAIKQSTDIMENPFYGVALSEKLATISHILGKYLLMLFVPYPLSCDYSFNQIPFISWSNVNAFVPLLVFITLGTFAFITFKKKNIFSFCILFFFVTISIVSNVFFNIGAPMGERFVFLPSFAVCLALSVLIMKLMKQSENAGSVLPAKLALPLLVLLIPAAYLTITRNPDWKDNETLFAKDVETVPNSGKVHYYYGNILYNYYIDSVQSPRRKYLLATAKHHTLTASAIAPTFFFAHLNLGKIYMEEENGDSAIYHFNKVTEIIPPTTIKVNGATAITASKTYIQAMQNAARCWTMLKKMPDKGIEVLNIALQYKQDDPQTLEYLGICNLMKNDNANALKYFNASLQIDPNNAGIYDYLGQMYRNANDPVKAKEYFDKAAALKAPPR